MAKEINTKKIKLDTSWQAKKRTERFEFRCSPNFNIVAEALMEKDGKHSQISKADLMVKALKALAEKEKLLMVGDSYYI